jgi:dinuclear metal center YbgI/SA1388 family protein
MTSMPSTPEIARYLDDFLEIGRIGDWPNALNGLQIENSGRVTRIGAAVDASSRTLREAARDKIDFLIVHHGLFWPGLQTVTGALHRQLKIAFENDIALYSAHLSLDVHPQVGNNAQLASALECKDTAPFLEDKGQPVGLKADISVSRKEMLRRVEKSLAVSPKAFLFGPEQIEHVGIVTGAAGSEIYRVFDEGIDTFITGEAPHWAAVAAEELKINLILGGHYATETFGVKATAAQLSDKFQLPWQFIDCPTGM